MSNKWSRVSLRLRSEVLKAEDIELAIGETASRRVNPGDQVSERSSQAGVHAAALCTFDMPVARSEEMQVHLEALSGFLIRHDDAIRSLRSACKLSIWIGYASGTGQGGFVIPQPLLDRFSECKADMFVNLFPPEDPEPESR
jgi:hypothetical protein